MNENMGGGRKDLELNADVPYENVSNGDLDISTEPIYQQSMPAVELKLDKIRTQANEIEEKIKNLKESSDSSIDKIEEMDRLEEYARTLKEKAASLEQIIKDARILEQQKGDSKGEFS